jgi:hypothetical protein
MDLYKNACCNELRRLLEEKQRMENDQRTTVEQMAKMCVRINRLVDMLSLIDRQEMFDGKKS